MTTSLFGDSTVSFGLNGLLLLKLRIRIWGSHFLEPTCEKGGMFTGLQDTLTSNLPGFLEFSSKQTSDPIISNILYSVGYYSTSLVDSTTVIQHIFGSLIPCLCIYDIISLLHTCPVISQDLSFETCFWASHLFLVTFLCKTWIKANRFPGNNRTWHLHPLMHFMHNMHS